jgi:single-stranded DNA-binding protein
MGTTVVVVGNLGADPVSKDVGGKTVVNLRVFSDEYKWDDVAKQYEAAGGEWYDVAVWTDGLGRMVMDKKVFQKGLRVQVEGVLKVNRYAAKDGTPAFSLNVIAHDVMVRGNRIEEIVLKRREGEVVGGGQEGGV